MASGRKYLLDSNVFIEAKKRYYSFKVCPGFWEALLTNYRKGTVRSIDLVRAEMVDLEDELSEWVCNSVPEDFFDSTNETDVWTHYAALQSWALKHPLFKPEAKAEFAARKLADPWLIAYAKAFDFVVVTHETYQKDRINRIKIPNACVEFDVKYIDAFQMLDELETAFVLRGP